MGTISVADVIDKAAILLEDRVNKSWPKKELLGWLNDGQIAILQYRPDAYSVSRVQQLVAGTKQAVPPADLRILDIPRNMGTGGQTPGRAIRFIDRNDLDLVNPGWHNKTASATVRHWIYDQRVPKVWWCYPPQPATSRGFVEMFVSAIPPTMTVKDIDGATVTSALGLDDTWMNALLVWSLYRAFSKDNEYTQPGGKASMALSEFLQIVTGKTETHKAFDPTTSVAPKYRKPLPGHVGPFGDSA